ncbi:BrnA antitoxin family protein [Methylocystis rosea]|uniref:BrnA antitoxin family protein n=1 Tax=Methylocystis rosea TaxID=173366 RepID=UPI001FDFE112|nr:BrnA antitoxin family protein [Methylocystis rosea]
MPDDEIDTKDIPEAPAENWAFAHRGAFYKPIKQPVNIRIDADVLDWFKRHTEGRGYQTEINRVLRRHVIEKERQR